MKYRVVSPPQNAWDRLCCIYGEGTFSGDREDNIVLGHGGRLTRRNGDPMRTQLRPTGLKRGGR